MSNPDTSTNSDVSKGCLSGKPIPLHLINQRILDNFWSKVDKTEDGCWLWTAGTNSQGYGQVSWREEGVPIQMRAHRVSYALAYGQLDPGMVVDHTCSVTGCVNPEHLELVTQHENILRGNTGANNAAKTHCPQGHPLVEGNLSASGLRKGWRSCRTCRGYKGFVDAK